MPALTDGIALEQLADLVKEHDGDGLGIIAAFVDQGNRHSADGCHRHEEVLVKDLSVFDALGRLEEDIVAHQQVGDQVQEEPDRFMHTVGEGLDGKVQHHHQHGRDQNAPEHDFLFFIHSLTF